jgi:signal transduction histidine kinase
LIVALDRRASVVRIAREEAPAFGLPGRTALAGLASVDDGGGRRWDIAVIASAERERDREAWAHRRLILSVIAAAGLVVAFGGIALAMQRKELVLERELALASLQQRRDERLERANKAAAMGTLAMGVAHEISTPLAVIAARGEQMVAKVQGDAWLSASVGVVLAQTERINQVIRGLLGLARGDAPTAQRIDPEDVIRNAVALVEHRFVKSQIQLDVKVHAADSGLGHRPAPETRPEVLGDPRLLEHAVVNLLLNACEASKGGAQVAIGLRREAGAIEIAVEDAGAGISSADVGRALEPFFTTKARQGGTGLGLAIAHEIVASHRGKLLFSPRAEGGTRAVIRLPTAEGGADGPVGPTRPPGAEGRPADG